MPAPAARSRIGKDLRNDFGPTRARPALPGSEGFIGEAASAGTSSSAPAARRWRATSSSTAIPTATACASSHRPFVGEAQAGIAILFRGVRITYTQVLRTPEFFERDRWDQFGSINVTFQVLSGAPNDAPRPRSLRYIRPISSKTITMIRIRPMPPLG